MDTLSINAIKVIKFTLNKYDLLIKLKFIHLI